METNLQRGLQGTPLPTFPRNLARAGFTLVELLVSTAIMLIVILVLLQVVAGMTNIWHTSTGSISTYQSARAAFTTMTRTLSRATLKSYIDYVDSGNAPFGNFQSPTTEGTAFVPSSFARNSALYFMCGPTANLYQAGGLGAPTANTLPGHCVIFQAPMGIESQESATTQADKFLPRSLNTVGFYVEYSTLSATTSVPAWLKTALNITNPPARFRLMQYLETTENMQVYKNSYSGGYVTSIKLPFQYFVNSFSLGSVTANIQNVVMAENIVLLVIRPRLEPSDEKTLAGTGTGAVLAAAPNGPYSATTANSIISPNYTYDSHGWWLGNTAALYTYNTAGDLGIPLAAAKLMRDQLPPILDVAMVAVDPNSIIRLGNPAAPPAALVVPAGLFGGATGGSTANASASMDADLAAYGTQLSNNHIRYRIFRTSIQMEGAAWVNN